MSSITDTSTSYSSYIAEGCPGSCREALFRRRLIIELSTIEEKLTHSEIKDLLSTEIVLWRNNFREALNTHSDIPPLDEECLLGNDGYCYGYKTLCLLESSLPPGYRARSPFDLENVLQCEFTTALHHLARDMVQWLKSHKASLELPQEIENAFQQLVTKIGELEVSRLLPNSRNHRLRRIHARSEFRKQEKIITSKIEQTLKIENDIKSTEITKEFQTLTNKVDEFAKKTLARLDVIEKNKLLDFQNIQQRTSNLEKKTTVLQHKIKKLNSEIEKISSEIDIAVQEQSELKLSIKEVEKAIEERTKKQKTAVVKTITIIGGCVLGTYLIQCVIATGSVAAIVPGNGGASLSIGIPF